MTIVRRAAFTGLLLLPGGLVVYTAFNGGGFFAGTQGWLAVALALALLLRATLAENPFGGASRLLALAALALGGFAIWTLLSAGWSDAPARALIEFDRALLYLLALLVFGTLPMTSARLRWILGGVALGALVVCAIALVTRTLPDVWPIAPNIANERLSYPITYWNTLGLLGALGAVLFLHATCGGREHPAVRVLGAAALPVLGATVYLTLSRGAIGAGIVGVAIYLLAARPRVAVTGLAAAVPATAAAVLAVYRADELLSEDPTTPAAVEQGGDAALMVGLCVVGAAAVRALGLWVDARILSRPPRRLAPALVASVSLVAIVAAAISFVSLGGPGYVGDQYKTFVERKQPRDLQTGDPRTRLTDPSSNGRVDEWRVAVDAWKTQRVRGVGAGTYQILWTRDRPYTATVVDAHSLYVEVLAELGLVGLVLVALCVLTLLGGALARVRGPDRALYAAAFAALLVWALRAGADWDWEMPVVTLWVFCVGGAVLATPLRGRGQAAEPEAEPRRVGAPPRLLRVVLGLGCLLLAITPFRVAQSQRHLDAAAAAYGRGDCGEAVERALSSLEAEQVRPEPRLVLAYCNLRLGRPRLALRQAQAAVQRDPESWRARYVLAVTLGLAGRDPRPQMRRALDLNPREELVQAGLRRFASARTPRQWQRGAQRARLPGL